MAYAATPDTSRSASQHSIRGDARPVTPSRPGTARRDQSTPGSQRKSRVVDNAPGSDKKVRGGTGATNKPGQRNAYRQPGKSVK